MSEIDVRRKRASEAAWEALDRSPAYYGARAGISACVEVATQVKITEEAIEAFDDNRNGSMAAGDIRAGLAAALTALGFEVIE